MTEQQAPYLHEKNLAAAMLAITTEMGKVGYLYPAPKQALARYIRKLEADNAKLKKKLASMEADNAELRLWAGVGEPKPSGVSKAQPFYMWVEEE